MTATIDDPHDIAVIDDGDGIYAVFAINARACSLAEDVAPMLKFKHGTGGILSVETTVAAAWFCCKDHARGFCDGSTQGPPGSHDGIDCA